MSKIIKSDLTGAEYNKFIYALNQDIDNTDELIKKMNAFIDYSSAYLKGAEYNAVRDKLSKYLILLNKRKGAATGLIEAINSAKSNMINFMEEYTELDNANIQSLSNAYYQTLSLLKDVKKSQDNANISEAKIEVSQAQLEYELYALNKILNKLEELAPTDNEIYRSFSGIILIINSYKSRVNELSTSYINM